MTAILKAVGEKTFKREVAVFVLLFLCLISWKAATAEIKVNEVNQALETLKIIILPGMGFVFAAFGMDWINKQTNFAK